MITFMQAYINELESEAIGTRKLLALVPSDKADWKPHAKSMALNSLAVHIADIPRWITLGIETDVLDFAQNPYNPPKLESASDLVAYFDSNVKEAIEQLTTNNDSILENEWTMRNGEMVLMTLTKLETLRHSFGQLIHHRAQLGVYLRLLDIPIPGVYGPSADEHSM